MANPDVERLLFDVVDVVEKQHDDLLKIDSVVRSKLDLSTDRVRAVKKIVQRLVDLIE